MPWYIGTTFDPAGVARGTICGLMTDPTVPEVPFVDMWSVLSFVCGWCCPISQRNLGSLVACA